MAGSWTAVLPIRAASGKSRLGDDLTEIFALDTIAAIRGARGIVRIITVGRSFTDVGVHSVDDPGQGLNSAIAAGMTAIDADTPLLVVLGDLPALRSGDVEQVLAQAADVERGIVNDHLGTGTTMVTSRRADFTPQFGPDSAARFRNDGFVQLQAPLSARLDVDTPSDLDRAIDLGVGSATHQWLQRNGAASRRPHHNLLHTLNAPATTSRSRVP